MTQSADLLQEILLKLNHYETPPSKWPTPKGEYWALCPFHDDHHPTNFSVSARGYCCFACGEKGSLRKLALKLGIETPSNELSTSLPATLKNYAEYKQLPVEFLQDLGLKTITKKGVQCLRIPYYDQDGCELTHRIRWMIGRNAKQPISIAGSKIYPYGLWKLPERKLREQERMLRVQACSCSGGECNEIIIVEGESDTQTLWFYGIPALGLPGAGTWNKEFTHYLEGYRVYIWQEPDSGGNTFVNSIGKDIPGALIITPPVGRKDISEIHMLGEDVPVVIQTLKASAVPYATLHADTQKAAAIQAAGKAGELLKSQDILSLFWEACERSGLVGEERNCKILYLALTSRFLDRPVSLVVKGTSSSGKSFQVEIVLPFFPASAYYVLSSMSERALAYSEEPLSHRFLVLYEVAGMNSEFTSYLLRSLLSEGKIRYLTVEKTRDGMRPRLIDREGPTGLLLTTTQARLHPENETRLLSLTSKDDPEQTVAVLKILADRQNGTVQRGADLEPWIALQQWLELAGKHQVKIPYAPMLADDIKPKAVRLRRDFTQVLNLISAHAILHQLNREIDEESGRIIANMEDYRAVYELVSDLLDDQVMATVSKTTRETVEAVKKLMGKDNTPVNISKVGKALGIDRSAASRRVAVAISDEYLHNLEEREGRPAKIVVGDPMPEEEPILPSPERLQEKYSANIPSTTAARVHATVLVDTEHPLVHAPSDEDIEGRIKHGETLARQARELDEKGDHARAEALRKAFDGLFTELDGMKEALNG